MRELALSQSDKQSISASATRALYCFQKLQEFLLMEPGWYFGKGEKISTVAIKNAKKVIFFSREVGIWKANVFPGSDGAVRLTYIQNGHEIDIRFDLKGNASWLHQFQDEDIAEYFDLDIQEVIDLIYQAAEKVCTSSEPSIQNSLTKLKIGGPVKPSSLLMTGGYRYSTKIVPKEYRDRSVLISKHFTHPSWETRSFSGSSMSRCFQ